jgi:DNA-binding LytR/AlgR family response regulator
MNRMDEIEKYLPKYLFLRMHRSYIVNVRRVKGFDNFTVYLHPPSDGKIYSTALANTTEIPLGKSYRVKFRNHLNIIPNKLGHKPKLLQNAEFRIAWALDEA